MTDPLQVTPDELRATSEHLAAVSSQMKGVLSSLQGKVSGEGEPWGDDETGDSFAEGPNGYLAQQDWVNTDIDGRSVCLE